MKAFLSNLLIFLLLICLVWIGVKGISFLGSRTSTVSETIGDQADKATALLSDAKDKTLNKGEEVMEAIRGTEVLTENETTMGEDGEDFDDGEEEFDEKLPYERDEANESSAAAAKEALENAKMEAEEKVSNQVDKITETAKKAVDDNKSTIKEKTSIQGKKAEETVQKTVTATNTAKKKVTPKPYAKASIAPPPYMVIVGSFSVAENADNEVKRLKKAGYPNAERIKASTKNLHYVSIDRFAKKASAKQLVSKLSAKGIEAYLRVNK